jgi:hypothetical protein
MPEESFRLTLYTWVHSQHVAVTGVASHLRGSEGGRMTPADKLLTRLDKVRQVKPSQWVALCPAHADKTPSLRITEVEDGKLLLKCWAGCTTKEVVTAIGLEQRDLFQSCGSKANRTAPSRAAVDLERMVYRIGQSQIASGKELSATDRQRLALARDRLDSLGGSHER